MNDADRIRLLFGPYCPPALRKGDRATCLFWDCLVRVTGWSDARIPWPRCRPGASPRGRQVMLVEEELARAVRHESAAALAYWWGVTGQVVAAWRKALGVGRVDPPGSRRLVRAAARDSVRKREPDCPAVF